MNQQKSTSNKPPIKIKAQLTTQARTTTHQARLIQQPTLLTRNSFNSIKPKLKPTPTTTTSTSTTTTPLTNNNTQHQPLTKPQRLRTISIQPSTNSSSCSSSDLSSSTTSLHPYQYQHQQQQQNHPSPRLIPNDKLHHQSPRLNPNDKHHQSPRLDNHHPSPRLNPLDIHPNHLINHNQQQQQQQQQQQLKQQQQALKLQQAQQQQQLQAQQHQQQQQQQQLVPSSSTPSSSTTTITTPTVIERKLNHPLPLETHDHARVNRKILDLEISNASLLAINGALERTKVKQQNEIRSLKRTINLASSQAGQSNHNLLPLPDGSETSSSSSSNSTLLNHPFLGPEDQLQDGGDEKDEDLAIERLMENDPLFSELVKTIEWLMDSATKAIHHTPASPPPSSPPPTTTAAAATTTSINNQLLDSNIHRTSSAIGKTKVLNQLEIDALLNLQKLSSSQSSHSSLTDS
ncbi:hypothetical protein PGT21_030054 [Puccinia graminis f. sp. tritici]|uniref:Uncharacterized protein n=1 Tax=Puccinia graminis f. sp. tritici TaxID=56615 RepID=A0A5B0N0E7_PUCGR|nr:hypothetical protein PGT21_030054 [Puccinia graminis f. sp. tritici]KAA1081986.1 hypothetical protein PGTUg99_031545 [Puccinia graminis f. sp. tritici]